MYGQIQTAKINVHFVHFRGDLGEIPRRPPTTRYCIVMSGDDSSIPRGQEI